jgi:hypothetical protein
MEARIWLFFYFFKFHILHVCAGKFLFESMLIPVGISVDTCMILEDFCLNSRSIYLFGGGDFSIFRSAICLEISRCTMKHIISSFLHLFHFKKYETCINLVWICGESSCFWWILYRSAVNLHIFDGSWMDLLWILNETKKLYELCMIPGWNLYENCWIFCEKLYEYFERKKKLLNIFGRKYSAKKYYWRNLILHVEYFVEKFGPMNRSLIWNRVPGIPENISSMYESLTNLKPSTWNA